MNNNHRLHELQNLFNRFRGNLACHTKYLGPNLLTACSSASPPFAKISAEKLGTVLFFFAADLIAYAF